MANKQLPDFITAENDLDGNEPVYIAQNSKTRKTLLSKIKEFIIGTTSMGTTATDVTGAVKEINDKVGSIDVEKDGNIATQLNANTQEITTHKSALVTDVSGAHGLNIETGTWTPTIEGSIVAGTHTYNVQVGRYIKINKLVACFFRIVITKGNDASGDIYISSLPYVAKGENANRAGLIISNINNVTLGDGFTQFIGGIIPSQAKIRLSKAGSSANTKTVTADDLATKIEISGSITYEIS